MARKYQLKFGKDVQVDEEFLTWADALFSELGFAPEIAQRIADRWGEYTHKRMTSEMARSDQEIASLKAQWGDTYESSVAAGRAAVKKLGITNAELAALEHAAGFLPAMSLFARLGRGISTDATTGKSTLTILSPEDARAELSRLQGDKDFQATLRDTKNEAARRQALAKWEHLYAMAEGQADGNAAPSTTPTPAPKPASSTPDKSTAAIARIEQLKGDVAFQDRMRTPGPQRESAVNEWNTLHLDAYPEGQPAGGQS
jgi:hypothetical protein